MCSNLWGCKEVDTTELLDSGTAGGHGRDGFDLRVGRPPGEGPPGEGPPGEVRRPPGGGNGNHSSILAWEIPPTEEPGGLQSGVAKQQTRLSDEAATNMIVPLKKTAHGFLPAPLRSMASQLDLT